MWDLPIRVFLAIFLVCFARKIWYRPEKCQQEVAEANSIGYRKYASDPTYIRCLFCFINNFLDSISYLTLCDCGFDLIVPRYYPLYWVSTILFLLPSPPNPYFSLLPRRLVINLSLNVDIMLYPSSLSMECKFFFFRFYVAIFIQSNCAFLWRSW